MQFLSSDLLRMPFTARASHSDRLTDSAFTHGFKQPLRRRAYPLVAQVEIVPDVGKARQPFGFRQYAQGRVEHLNCPDRNAEACAQRSPHAAEGERS